MNGASAAENWEPTTPKRTKAIQKAIADGGTVDPTQLTAHVLAPILSSLTDHGKKRFGKEFSEALEASQSDDMRPVQCVVEAWYRTLIIRQDAKYFENMARQLDPAEKPFTFEELKQQLSV
jgi:hypothetical protein